MVVIVNSNESITSVSLSSSNLKFETYLRDKKCLFRQPRLNQTSSAQFKPTRNSSLDEKFFRQPTLTRFNNSIASDLNAHHEYSTISFKIKENPLNEKLIRQNINLAVINSNELPPPSILSYDLTDKEVIVNISPSIPVQPEENIPNNFLPSLSSDLDDEDDDEDDSSSYSSRRETIIFKPNTAYQGIKVATTFEKNDKKIICSSNNEISFNEFKEPGTISVGSLACEVASLSSMASNYSQFDFLNNVSRFTPSPPPLTTGSDQPSEQKINKTSNNTLTSFFFSNSLFNKKQNIPNKTNINEQHMSTFDLITSKFLSLKTSKINNTLHSNGESVNAPVTYSLYSSSSSSLSQIAPPTSDNHSIKSNQSANNLNSLATDLKIPSSVLIFENRPSNLPAKSKQEAEKHKQEYEKMVSIARKKEKKDNELKLKRYEQQIKKEDFMANSLRIWNTEILKNWQELKNAKRTQQLWWHGLPPSIRGQVWKLAIGNELNLNKESFIFYEKIAKEKLEHLKQKSDNSTEKFHESSVELIKLDVSRTFPQLCFFQRDGPYHQALHSVLCAYACYNTRIGYVQGMSFLTAILLLNMEDSDAFICLANLLNTKYLLACFCMDQIKMSRYFRVHQILFEHNIPKLYKHFEEQKVKPDLYLIEWIFTLFSKSLPLDVMSRVWDVFFRDKEEFLFRTSLGILNMYKETLLEMDFIHIVQFLTKLPENINCTQLFKSIEQISTNIDETYFTFDQLMFQVVISPSLTAKIS